MKRAFLHTNETPPSFANNSFHSPLHYFPSVSDRWFGEGVRLSFTCKQWFSLPSPFGEGAGERPQLGCSIRLCGSIGTLIQRIIYTFLVKKNVISNMDKQGNNNAQKRLFIDENVINITSKKVFNIFIKYSLQNITATFLTCSTRFPLSRLIVSRIRQKSFVL